MALTLVDAQFLHTFARVLSRHAEIVSGAYKLRKIQQGDGTNPDGTIQYRDLTDAEKLADSLAVMKRHVDRLMDLEDYIGEHQKEGVPCEPEPKISDWGE
jgi:hypothetical protein